MRGKCERGRGSANADGAGAEAFAGDACSQGASFGPMAAISQRWRGGRIYNNTRTRERLRRKCVKPRRPHNPFPAEDLLPPTHSDTPFPSTSARPRSADTRPRSADARPQAVRYIFRRPHHPFPAEDLPSPRTATRPPKHFCSPTQRRRTPADLTTHSPPKTSARPRTATRPPRTLPLPHAAPTYARRLRNAFPAALTTHSPQRRPASPYVPLRAQKNGTAQCMCDAECLGRPSLRSVIGVGEPRAVRRRCGALAWRVGLRPQPWALRSRRCGRVLRA